MSAASNHSSWAAIPAAKRPSSCPAGCGAAVRYVRMESGARNPVEPDPSEDKGNIVIRHGVGRQLGNAEAETARDEGYALYLSHFATCPAHRAQQQEAKEQKADPPTGRRVDRGGRSLTIFDGGAA